ncbi:hypothetical protein [Streptomyces sp. NPDC001816]|uniref:hypothetical protein n=1 Tax=Streptomyces sp. NPDC001816 TaxID=3364612 RepID=UPI0036936362
MKLSTFYRSRLPELTIGSEEARALTAQLPERSGVDARTVAKEMLHAAGSGHFYVVTPRQARILWSAKRHAPRLYQRLMPAASQRLISRLTREIDSVTNEVRLR